MPFAIFTKIREVSSEDKIHIAQNLISSKAGKKWKTKSPGEVSAYVILEMPEDKQICGIDIGNEHSAFIQILVGKANSSPGDFKDILLTSSFMTPIESRNSTNINRVRCFNYEALEPSAATNKWSLVKVVCTQPFNKHVQYGLSFIKVHVPQENAIKANDVKKKFGEIQNKQNFLQIGKYKLREESPDSGSEHSLRLFNCWKTLKHSTNLSQNTECNEIKKAIKHLDNSSTTLETSSKTNFAITANSNTLNRTLSKKHTKTDNVVESSPKQDKEKKITPKSHKKRGNKTEDNEKQITPESHKKRGNKTEDNEKKVTPESHKRGDNKTESIIKDNSLEFNKRKRKKSPTKSPNKKSNCDRVIDSNKIVKYKTFGRLLEHIVLVISGIQNPDRSDLRNKALALGAKYKANWDNTCTHLICAFKNTPKYNEVKGKGRIVRRTWLEKCYDEKKYLPWRRFALDESDSLKDESDEEILDESLRDLSQLKVIKKNGCCLNKNETLALYDVPPSTSKILFNDISESDTDDEIDRAQQKMQQDTSMGNYDIYEATTEEEDYSNYKLKS